MPRRQCSPDRGWANPLDSRLRRTTITTVRLFALGVLLAGIASCATSQELAVPTTTSASDLSPPTEADERFCELTLPPLNFEIDEATTSFDPAAPPSEAAAADAFEAVNRVDEIASAVVTLAEAEGAQPALLARARALDQFDLLDEGPGGEGLPFLSAAADLNNACTQLGFDPSGESGLAPLRPGAGTE